MIMSITSEIAGAAGAGMAATTGLVVADLAGSGIEGASKVGTTLSQMTVTALLGTALVLSLGLLGWICRFVFVKLVELQKESTAVHQETRDVLKEVRDAVSWCKNHASKLVALLVLASAVGCQSSGPKLDLNKIYKDLQEQPRIFSPATFKGTNMTVTIEGLYEWKMEAPLNPITIVPQQPDTIRAIADGITRVGTVGTAAYIGGKLSEGPKVVTQPAPTIVSPEIVTIPGK
jgi:hypothetical protein